jgi:hypothetical protein
MLAMSSYNNWEISDNVPQNDDQLDPNPEFRSVSLWIAHIEWNILTMTISLTPTPNIAQFLFELLTLNGTKCIEGRIDE